jgi:hypothetical protein
MFIKLKVAFSAAIILAATSAAPAKDGGVPSIDLEKVCRASQTTISAVFGDAGRDVFQACMDDEQGAREQLVRNWATYPAFERERCVLPREYQPSYVEWFTCIEMTMDVRRMRKERSSSMPAGSNSKQCPVVQLRDDGSIDWVIAC